MMAAIPMNADNLDRDARMPGERKAGTDIAIRFKDVDLVYPASRGAVTALSGLSFDVPSGSFVSVLGPSGCGKSTLLKLACGLLLPTRGTVELSGRKIERPSSDVGIVFQQPTLLPWKTVLDNVLVPIRAQNHRVSDYRAKALALLKMTKLEEFANYYPNELSGGMQQRVSIARGLIHDPSALLMDEPFAALDAMTREMMMEELQSIWMADKKSVLFITHSIPEAVFLSDFVVVLAPRPGRLLRIVEIDLPRPRNLASMSDPRFIALSNDLRQIFKEMEIK